MKTLTRLLVIVSSSAVIVSCASQSSLEIPQEGPTTLEVYQRHIGDYGSVFDSQDNDADKSAELDAQPTDEQTASLNAEILDRSVKRYRAMQKSQSANNRKAINRQFSKLPNPEFVMTVYPHVTDRGNPIPLYSTVWSLFEKDHYAMPGEVVIEDIVVESDDTLDLVE